MDLNFLTQVVIGMLVITAPPDPVKLLIFNATIERDGASRAAAALRVAVTVFIILGGAALFGARLLGVLGINLDAFSVVGGVVVALMGFEMLHGGLPSKAQGQNHAKAGPEEDSGLVMPLAIPLIAGPGAIVTTITLASSEPEMGWVAALIGAAVVALLTVLSFVFLGGAMSRMSSRTTALITRLAGLVLATIGTQMLLGGLKDFFSS
jgi:multiple antibiotic resistance protein